MKKIVVGLFLSVFFLFLFGCTTSPNPPKNDFNFIDTNSDVNNSFVPISSNLVDLNNTALSAQEELLTAFSTDFAGRLEKYLALDKNQRPLPFEKDYVDKNLSFEELKQEFKKQVFLTDTNEVISDSMVQLITDSIFNDFNVGTIGKYHYTIQDTQNQRSILFSSIKKAFENQSSQKDWLEVPCNELSCPDGTFYVIIPFNLIEGYNNLPKITVTDTLTNEIVNIPLIPKEELRVHILSDLFTRIYESRK